MTDSRTVVRAYVRLVPGKDADKYNYRWIHVPRQLNGADLDISASEWLEFGYAFDGNELIREVDILALAHQEKELTKFLADHDYAIIFV